MTASAIIVTPEITNFVAATREMLVELRDAEHRAQQLGRAFEDAQQLAQTKRMLMGRHLLDIRTQLPKRGTTTNGWGAFLGAVELDESTAWRYMKLAEATLNLSPEKDKVPTYAEIGLDKREGAQPDPDAPPPSDDDAPPSEGTPIIEINEPPPPANRDGWCTPDEIVAALPEVDLDPCSNEHSSVRAKTTYSLEPGRTGSCAVVRPGVRQRALLEAAAVGSAPRERTQGQAEQGEGRRLHGERRQQPRVVEGADPHLTLRLDFNERIEFKPPPGVEPSKNDRPQTLLMDAAFWKKCNRKALLAMGTLWERA
jgi:hypothetical protein